MDKDNYLINCSNNHKQAKELATLTHFEIAISL
nr:MAG TPA: hypothetical protein [Caudoviricetes sp.]